MTWKRPPRTYLYKIKIDKNGYDTDGHYYGIGPDVYRYHISKGPQGEVRASSRTNAKEEVRKLHPSLSIQFYL